jgi:hypothetical protein
MYLNFSRSPRFYMMNYFQRTNNFSYDDKILEHATYTCKNIIFQQQIETLGMLDLFLNYFETSMDRLLKMFVMTILHLMLQKSLLRSIAMEKLT